MRYSEILIKLTLRQSLVPLPLPAPPKCRQSHAPACKFPLRNHPFLLSIALRASRAATVNPCQTFHRAVWLFTRIRFNRIRLIRRRVLEIPSRS